MGLAFISIKRADFEHRRDLAKNAELCSVNLLSKLPEERFEQYRCELTANNVHLRLGEAVLVYCDESGEIAVVRVNNVIGRALPEDAHKLRQNLMQFPGQMLAASVAKIPRLGKRFSIQIEPLNSDA